MGLHRIRLAAPWEVRLVTSLVAETDATSSTCKLPFALSDVGVIEPVSDSDTIVLTRKFHRPSGLDESTRVLIGIELDNVGSSESLKTVLLNKAALSFSGDRSGANGVLHVDVSGRLLAFNVLQLQFPVAASHTPVHLISVNLLIEEQAVVD
ncbi:MAG: hypothetical protein NT138_05200 [Planctomycetales bacterium]|jgi:hypothetical protein|nr:hypothetical protein [Planctomycetales bacterium]